MRSVFTLAFSHVPDGWMGQLQKPRYQGRQYKRTIDYKLTQFKREVEISLASLSGIKQF
jgi:hypothetical protein